MAGLTVSLKRQLDLPAWEWLRPAPAISATGISCSCAADNSRFHPQHGRYIYYLISAAAFWRYDTWTDTYVQLSSPPITVATWARMKFAGSLGPEGLALAGGANTITIPSYFGKTLKGFDIRIVGGTGMGQQRVITDVADPVSADNGVATAVANALGGITITDSTKSWAINQWAGYSCRITFGSGIAQVRRVLYNSATVLTLADSAISAQNNWSNPMIFSPAISATAGSQSMYSIESAVATVDSNWATQPDATSIFRISSGAIMLASSAAATPFYTLQLYDIQSDTWYIRTANTLNVNAAGTDGAIERTTENGSIWERGTATTAGTTTTLTDANKSWIVNQWVGYWVRIFSGTGEGQLRQISANTATQLTWITAGTAPDTTSNYTIEGFDAGTATSGGASTLTDSAKSWAVNRWANYALRITGGTGKGQIFPIASNTSTAITVVRPWATQPDSTSTYSIQGDIDKFYLALGGVTAIYIHNMDDDLMSLGRWCDGGAARSASVQYGATKAVAIASATHATTTATITTANPHGFKVGWSVTVKGMTDANYNGPFTIASVPSTTTFTYTMGGTPAADTLAGSQSTSTLCDKSKSWTTNQWAGYMCYMTTTAVTAATGLATGQALQVASNTADTLTFVATGTAPTNGVSRYVLTPRNAIGGLDNGIATGGSQATTTLGDSGKSWVTNIHAGKRVCFIGGAGQAQIGVIASNTATVLTFGASGTAPVAGSTSYVILDQGPPGLGFDMAWNFGASDANMRGKYLVMARGGAVVGFNRVNIGTDRIDLMPITPQLETLTSGSMYAYDGGDRVYFTKDLTQRMYYIDVVTNVVHGAGIFPYLAGSACLGNRMEIFETEDHLKFLWLNRHLNVECFRQLLFY